MPEKKKSNQNYQAPKMVKIGSFQQVTLGGKREDTADESSHRW